MDFRRSWFEPVWTEFKPRSYTKKWHDTFDILILSIFLIAFIVSLISKCQEANKNRTHFWPFARKCQKCQKCQCEFLLTFPKWQYKKSENCENSEKSHFSHFSHVIFAWHFWHFWHFLYKCKVFRLLHSWFLSFWHSLLVTLLSKW